jgi:hypothetical protein
MRGIRTDWAMTLLEKRHVSPQFEESEQEKDALNDGEEDDRPGDGLIYE